jgi:hypothetical protein
VLPPRAERLVALTPLLTSFVTNTAKFSAGVRCLALGLGYSIKAVLNSSPLASEYRKDLLSKSDEFYSLGKSILSKASDDAPGSLRIDIASKSLIEIFISTFETTINDAKWEQVAYRSERLREGLGNSNTINLGNENFQPLVQRMWEPFYFGFPILLDREPLSDDELFVQRVGGVTGVGLTFFSRELIHNSSIHSRDAHPPFNPFHLQQTRLLLSHLQTSEFHVPANLWDEHVQSYTERSLNENKQKYETAGGVESNFTRQEPSEAQIVDIHSFIKTEENFNALTSNEGMTLGTATVFLSQGLDCISMEDFDPAEQTEWCLLTQGVNKFNLVTAETAQQLISFGNRHPFDQRELRAGDIVRGKAALDLLHCKSV